jgi:hypothetical protein
MPPPTAVTLRKSRTPTVVDTATGRCLVAVGVAVAAIIGPPARRHDPAVPGTSTVRAPQLGVGG